MLETLKKNYIQWLVSLAIVIIGTICTGHWMMRQNSKTELYKKLEQKADIEYVKEQDKLIRADMEARDSNIISLLRQHMDESSKTNEIMLEYLKSINSKVINVTKK